jgi:phasin family protein
MYPFSQAVNPAVRTHIDAQTAYLNDMSKTLFQSFQQLCNLNIQLVQTMVEESTLASRQLFSGEGQSGMLSAAASRAQPASEKLRAYQQHMSRLAADAQVEMARVTEQHAQNTARTARAVADEVTRTATEQAEQGMRTQQETMRRFADPFERSADASMSQAQEWADSRGPQTMQSAGQQATSQGGQQQGMGPQGSQQQGMGQQGSQPGSQQGAQQGGAQPGTAQYQGTARVGQ